MENSKEILKSDWFMVAMIILFCPLGLLLMWKNRRFSFLVRIILTILLGGSYFIIVNRVF